MSADGPAPGERGALVRAIDTRALTFNAVNLTIGTTVYVVPALIAAEVGRWALVSYLACAALMTLVVLCFAEAGSRVPSSGGSYAWVEQVFGSFAAFLLGWLLYAGGLALGAASVMQLLFRGLSDLAPIVNAPVPHALLVVLILSVMAALNVRGVRRSARLVEGVTIIKLAPLAIILVTGVGGIVWSNLSLGPWPGTSSFGHSLFLVIFLFAGIENALLASGEVADPTRSVPRAVMLALGIVTVLYLAAHVVAQGVLGDELARRTAAPIADMAASRIGGVGRQLVLFAMIVAPLSYLLGELLSAPRILYAMARDGFLPKAVARVHDVHHTPHVAIWLHAGLVALLVLTRSFEWLAIVSSVSTLLVYLVCTLATVQLRRREVRLMGPPFVLPLGVAIPVVAALVMIALMFAVRRDELLAVAAMVVAGSALYGLTRVARRARPQG
ncbi:MAG: APC family permease [Gemmatimonadaceae bacterium]